VKKITSLRFEHSVSAIQNRRISQNHAARAFACVAIVFVVGFPTHWQASNKALTHSPVQSADQFESRMAIATAARVDDSAPAACGAAVCGNVVFQNESST